MSAIQCAIKRFPLFIKIHNRRHNPYLNLMFMYIHVHVNVLSAFQGARITICRVLHKVKCAGTNVYEYHKILLHITDL